MPTDPGRPAYHFTAPAGWINDPLGVTWHDGPEGGRYELFYQFNPEAPVWVPAIRWGQATSRDLVRWRDPRTALEPGPDETGCWSGSVVVDAGRPVIVYTSVLADAPGMGRIALAEGDAHWRRWTRDPAGPVLPAPDPDRGLAHVRDPFVWRDGDEWRMAVGAGSTDGRPSVLQYSSPDLRTWRADGVLAEPEPNLPGPGGTVWECPQLFRLDGAWALIVSVWDEVPGGVACALGDYDGHRFAPRSWQWLATDPFYATTAFADSRGRRCALSWVQDADAGDGVRAGALSVPWLLAREGDRVTVAPHPDVESLRTEVQAGLGPTSLAGAPVVVGPLAAHADVDLRADPAGGPLVLTLDEAGGRLLTLVADPAAAELRLTVPGRPAARTPLQPEADGGLSLRLLVDAGVVEVFGGGGVAAARLRPPGGELTLAVSSGAAGAELHRLVIHGMAPATG
jgi:beta-fructofuranosidase